MSSFKAVIRGILRLDRFLSEKDEEKGYVERDRKSAVQLFNAVIDRQTYASGQLEAIAEKLTGGSIAPLITHLMEQRKISPDEIEQLRSLLDKHDEGGQKNV